MEGVTTTTDVGDGYTDSELTALGLNIYNIGEGGDYDLTNTTLNSSSTPKAMHAVFRHTILSDSDIEKAKLGNDVTTQPTLSTTEGVRYVYNMGNYWNDGGHPGPSQFSNMINNNYDLTSTLIGQHGGGYNYRLMRGGSNGAQLVGVLKVSETTTTEYIVSTDLGFQPDSIIPHLQTRDNTDETYYSTVPGLNQYILLTHAQSTNLSGAGSVVVASDNLETMITQLLH